MKKLICLFFVLVFCVSLCSCGQDGNNKNVASKSNKTTSVSAETTENQTGESSEKIDYDLTALSTTMAYSQVSEMTNNSDKYLGKRVKITGAFLVQETDERNYYACHISDTTACCSVGFEFVLKDTGLTYPTDYPKANDTITVEGIFNTYKEGENTYCELKDAVMTK